MNLEQLGELLAGPTTLASYGLNVGSGGILTSEAIEQHFRERYEIFPYHGRPVFLFSQARAFGDGKHIVSFHGRNSGAVPEHIYQYVVFTYCYAGTLSMCVDGTRCVLAAGDCVILDRNVPHSVEPTDDRTFAVNVVLNDRFFLKRMASDITRLGSAFPRELVTTGAAHTDWRAYRTAEDEFVRACVDRVLCEHLDQRLGSADIIDDIVAALLTHLFRSFERSSSTPDERSERSALVGEIRAYIAQHYQEGSLSKMAQDLGYESTYLSSTIRKVTGHTFKQLVNDERMRCAMTLLQGTDIPVYDIAVAVGISNLTQFYKRFREFAECTPKEYRKRIGGASA